jgi:pycsar effector protein
MWLRRRLSNLPAEQLAPTPTPTAPDRTGIELGWRAHNAVQGWTASVDSKASIVVVVETAVAGAATSALITNRGELHNAVGLHLACAIAAVALLILAVICALLVVFPRLERSRTRRLAAEGLIYFGHLRERGIDDIAQALAELTPEQERRQLASQLCITGAVAWRKHSWLQRSLVCFALGAVVLVVTYTGF